MAARIREMTPSEMLASLHARLELLTSTFMDVPERQRTIRGTINWSYELLKAEEQQFLTQLAVFRGGFEGKAAAKVTEFAASAALLLALQHSSLVNAAPAGETTRYVLPATVQEFACEKLAAADTELTRSLCARHAEYYTAYAEAQIARWRTPEECMAMCSLSRELENCRAAWGWAKAHDDNLAARMSLALHPVLVRHGFWEEARHLVVDGLAAARRIAAPALEADLLVQQAGLVYDCGDAATAECLLAEALVGWRACADQRGEARTLNLRGIIRQESGDETQAQVDHEQALALRRVINDKTEEAISLHNLGLLAQRRQDLAAAASRYQEALAIRRSVGDLQGSAETMCNLGVLAQEAGDLALARSYYQECLPIWVRLGDKPHIATLLYNLGEVVAAEQPKIAASLLATAAHIFHQIGSPLAAFADSLLNTLSSQYALTPDTCQVLNEADIAALANAAQTMG